ncbi:MAG: hypothetical protein KatS3mg003_2059 [Candidatus Nitrosocaldaceae archaeon]|nr:MAG: hypothetical protein KatS3mg003_2059 [Candidatus Nitrosocaldaceae archaeon]
MRLAIAILAIAALSISISSVYAQEASVSIAEGSSIADCREDFSNECYNPGILTISKGTTVTWSNDDTTTHTVTSGISFGLIQFDEYKDKTPGPDGLFDSGMMAPGATFSYTFNDEGEYLYYCSLHPFMVGKVIVEAAAEEVTEANVMQGMNIDLETDLALPFDREANDSITLKFVPKAQGLEGGEITALVDHLDYNIVIMRDGEEIFNENFHDHDGVLELIIKPSDGPINIEGEAGDPPSTAPYTISGAIFNENGQYTIKASIVGIEFNPIESLSDEFSISVVPEFPLAALIPLVVGFTAVLAAMRVRKITF